MATAPDSDDLDVLVSPQDAVLEAQMEHQVASDDERILAALVQNLLLVMANWASAPSLLLETALVAVDEYLVQQVARASAFAQTAAAGVVESVSDAQFVSAGAPSLLVFSVAPATACVSPEAFAAPGVSA